MGASLDPCWRVDLDVPPAAPYSVHAAFDGSEGTIAWRGGWEPRPFVGFIDATTGSEIHRETCAALNLYPAAQGFFAMDHGWSLAGRTAWRVLAFRRTNFSIDVATMDVLQKTSLLGASPDGDQVLVFLNGRSRLHSWPDWDHLDGWDWYSPGVDWPTGVAWGFRDNATLELRALDGTWSRSVPVRPWTWELDSVGPGVLRLGIHGIRLFRPQGRLVTVLPPTSRVIRYVSAIDAGATVRAVLGDKPCRFLVDLDQGQVIEAPDDAAHLSRAPYCSECHALWHPTLDLVAIIRRQRTQVLSSTGERRFVLPLGARPLAWTPSRGRLLTIRQTGPESSALELWDTGT